MSRSITVDIYKHVGGNKNERQIVKSGVSVDEKQCMALIKDKSIYVVDTVSGKSITNRNIYDMFAGDGSQTKYYITDDNKIVFNDLTSLPHLFGMPKVGVLPENIDGPNPNTFTAIAPGAFSNVPTGSTAAGTLYNFCNLNSLTEIPAYAFFNNGDPAVTSVPSGVTSVGPHAYDNAIGNGIKSLNSNTALTSIGEWAFANGGYNNTASDPVIPEGITEIPDYAFYNCPGISKVVLPSSIKKIGKYAFAGCTNLTQIDYNSATTGNRVNSAFPDNLEEIGDYAFVGTKLQNLPGISDNSKLARIGNHAFDGVTTMDGTSFFNKAKKLKYIGDYAFNGCTFLRFPNDSFSQSVVYIGKRAFYNVKNVYTSSVSSVITFPVNNSIAYIGEGAFMLSGLFLSNQSIRLPNIQYIGLQAFFTNGGSTSSNIGVYMTNNKPSYISGGAFAAGGQSPFSNIYVGWGQNEVPGAPWGNNSITVHYNSTN